MVSNAARRVDGTVMSSIPPDETPQQILKLLHQHQGIAFRAEEVNQAVACTVAEAQRSLELLVYQGAIERQQSINGPVTYVVPQYAR